MPEAAGPGVRPPYSSGQDRQVRQHGGNAAGEDDQDEHDGAERVLIKHLDERGQCFDSGRGELERHTGSYVGVWPDAGVTTLICPEMEVVLAAGTT